MNIISTPSPYTNNYAASTIPSDMLETVDRARFFIPLTRSLALFDMVLWWYVSSLNGTTKE